MNEWVTLDEIYAAYLDCRKRKRNTKSCAIFEIYEAEYLQTLWEDLNAGTYTIGVSDAFCVTRPKVREVFAADFRDRIVHHLLMNKTGDLFEADFIDNTFNCRVGKGTNAAHKCVLNYANEYADGWVLDGDMQGFFMSIPKTNLADNLEAFLRAKYKGNDLEQVVWLTRMVALHKPQYACRRKGNVKLWDLLPVQKSLFTCGDNLGMAIGNLTSQIYANFYLSPFDHWLASMPGIGYCRYVDDIRLFAHDKQTLLNLLPLIRERLAAIGITLHPHKIELQQVRKGFAFVGANEKGGRLYIGNRTVGNAFNMIRIYNHLPEAEMAESVDKFVQRYNSYAGYMRHYFTYAVRWRMWNEVADNVKRFVYLSDKLCVLHARNKYRNINKLKLNFVQDYEKAKFCKKQYAVLGIQSKRGKYAQAG